LTFERFFERPVVTGNWLSGGASSRYPAGNRFDGPFDPAAAASAGANLARLRALAGSIVSGATSSTR